MNDNPHLVLLEPGDSSPVTNQGRFVRLESLRLWNKLVFGTESELRFAQALDRARIFYAPLAACRVTDQDGVRRTREVDFLIIDRGVAAVIELDGSPHNGRASEDHRRDRSLKRAGIWVVERFSSAEVLRDPDDAVRRVRGMIQLFKRTA